MLFASFTSGSRTYLFSDSAGFFKASISNSSYSSSCCFLFSLKKTFSCYAFFPETLLYELADPMKVSMLSTSCVPCMDTLLGAACDSSMDKLLRAACDPSMDIWLTVLSTANRVMY